MEDWETGETVTIPLDPAAPAADAAGALYKAARKQDRTGDAVEPIIQVGCFSLPLTMAVMVGGTSCREATTHLLSASSGFLRFAVEFVGWSLAWSLLVYFIEGCCSGCGLPSLEGKG